MSRLRAIVGSFWVLWPLAIFAMQLYFPRSGQLQLLAALGPVFPNPACHLSMRHVLSARLAWLNLVAPDRRNFGGALSCDYNSCVWKSRSERTLFVVSRCYSAVRPCIGHL